MPSGVGDIVECVYIYTCKWMFAPIFAVVTVRVGVCIFAACLCVYETHGILCMHMGSQVRAIQHLPQRCVVLAIRVLLQPVQVAAHLSIEQRDYEVAESASAETRTVPSNKLGSCGIMARLFRSWCSPDGVGTNVVVRLSRELQAEARRIKLNINPTIDTV